MKMSSEHARLVQQVRSIERTALPDDNSRVQLLTAAQALCQKLETPFEWVQRMTWQEVSSTTLGFPEKHYGTRIIQICLVLPSMSESQSDASSV